MIKFLITRKNRYLQWPEEISVLKLWIQRRLLNGDWTFCPRCPEAKKRGPSSAAAKPQVSARFFFKESVKAPPRLYYVRNNTPEGAPRAWMCKGAKHPCIFTHCSPPLKRRTKDVWAKPRIGLYCPSEMRITWLNEFTGLSIWSKNPTWGKNQFNQDLS